MHRLPGFDYKRPFPYMVALKRLLGLATLSPIANGNGLPQHTNVASLLPGSAILEIWYNLY